MFRVVLKILALLALVAAAGYVLFGTGGPDSGDRVTVSFWGAYEEWHMWQQMVAAYEKANPGKKVKMEYWVGGGYNDKVKIRLASGTPPDVILFQDEPFPPFCKFGKFQDLTEFLEAPGCPINLQRDYWDTAVESFKWKGRQYGIPVWGGNNLIYINKALFDRLGVPYPRQDWTIEEFLDTARRLTGDDDGDGRLDHYGFIKPYWSYLLPFFYAYGARLINTDGKHFVATDAARWEFVGPEAEAAFRFAQDLVWKHHVAPRDGEAAQMDSNVMFLTGRLGMFSTGPWGMPFLAKTDLDWDVVHVPRGPGGRATRITWDAVVMASDSPRQDRAWQFIRFLVSPEAQRIVAEAQRSVPALKAAQDAFVRTNPKVHVNRFIEAMAYARLQPITEHWQEMAQEIEPEFDKMMIGRQDPAVTVRNLAERMEKVFGRKEGGT